MEKLKVSKKAKPATFTLRIDQSIGAFYDDLARKTNRSRNELFGLALDYAKDKFMIENKEK